MTFYPQKQSWETLDLHCSWLARHLTWTRARAQHIKMPKDFHPQTFIHFTSRTDWETKYLTKISVLKFCLSHFQMYSSLLCAFLCCPIGHAMCIILILGSVSSIRKPLLAVFSPCHTRWTHRWTQRRSIGLLAQSAASTSCFILSSLVGPNPRICVLCACEWQIHCHLA